MFFIIALARTIEIDRQIIDILGGISWAMTAFWWAYAAGNTDEET